MHTLFLASSSASRQLLLRNAQIPFTLVQQNADEAQCYFVGDLPKFVAQVAALKMAHVMMPEGQEGQIVYVLTADTMTLDSHGVCHAKPFDRDDAISMIKACRAGSTVGSAFCLQRRVFRNGVWAVEREIAGYDEAMCVFDVSDNFIDFYLDRVDFLSVSGGVTIEKLGEQFVRRVDGCYSAIIGLPMFKVRQALDELGFYTK